MKDTWYDFKFIFSGKNIRPSLTNSKDGQIKQNIHNKTTIIYLRLLGGQYIPTGYGQEQWYSH